ncbi:MAG: plasmid replication protein, CyRepA1 family [Synechococcales bacterium]|nr:plasmid replication protein, CyRepA1 family [Synechococcales bacterium]
MSFTLYRGSDHCPVCDSHDGRCKTNDDALVLCMTLLDSANVPGYRFVKLSSDRTWGIWAPDDNRSEDDWQAHQDELERRRQRRERERQQKLARSMPAVERDRHYRTILSQLELHPTDRADLRRRGLTDADIERAGFKSVERSQKLSARYPVNLPGISSWGRSLVVAEPGYLCPVRDFQGRIVGLQLRVRGASDNKYRWVSRQELGHHLPNGEQPLAHFQGSGGKPWVAFVEGTGPKPFIASSLLGCPTIGAAGGQWASSPMQVQAALDALPESIPVLVPDAGAIANSHVMRQYRRIAELVPELRVLWWGQAAKEDGDIDEVAPNILEQAKLLSWEEFEALSCEPQKEPSWQEQYAAAAKRSWEKSRRFTPTQEVNQRFVSLAPGELLGTDIHALKSGMGTGKTHELARILSQTQAGAIAIGSRNSLLLQSCERWGGFYHLHNDSAFGLTRDPYSRIACCIDSLGHFSDSDFDGKIIILDEVLSIVKHGLLSGTLAGKRGACLAKLEQAIKRAAVVIAWDGNCADIAINYLALLRGPDCKVIKSLNRFKGDRLRVELVRAYGNEPDAPLLRDYSPVVRKLRETLANGNALPNGNITIISDSQRHCEALDDLLSADGYRVLRVDGKTVSDPEIKQFLTNPDAYISENKPQALIMSPTAESGIDISIKGYFGKGFGFFFGVIDTATQMQFLRRVRDCLDWSVWCQEYSTLEEWEGVRSPFAKRIQQEVLEALQMDALKAMEGDTDHSHLNELIASLKAQADDPHAQTALQFIAARNYERSHTRECLQQALEEDGHTVKLVNVSKDEASGKAVSAAKDAIAVADANAIYSAPDITTVEAFAIKSRFSASLEDRYSAEKALLKAKLPGIESTPHWSPSFILEVLFKDRGLLPRLERYWMLTHMDAAQQRAKQQWEAAAQSGALPTDIRPDYLRLRALHSLGITDLAGGSFTAEAPEIQRIFQRCRRSKKIQVALGRSPGKLAPMDFVGRLLASVGITSSSKLTQRDVNGDRQRLYTYSAPEESPIGAAILKALGNRFAKYLHPETAETVGQPTSDLDHLTPKDITPNGEGVPPLTLTGYTFEPKSENSSFEWGVGDEWASEEALADLQAAWEVAQSDPAALEELRRMCPPDIWRRVAGSAA